jgi:hypothetical protein
MKIKFTDAAAPEKRGTTAHVSHALAAALVAGGFAEAVPTPKRGAPGWLEARLEESKANFHGADPHDVDPSAMQKNLDRLFTNDPPVFPYANLRGKK